MKLIRHWPKVVSIITALAVVAGVSSVAPPKANRVPQAKAADGNMVLFWDGVSAPAGWTIISDGVGEAFTDRFVRGNSTYGTTGGSATHTHTLTYVSETAASGLAINYATPGGNLAILQTHVHGSLSSQSVVAADNLPPYRSLKVIEYTTGGTPTTIPSGAIAIFESTGAYGADWTTYTAEDNYFLRGGASVATGGNANHTHALSIGLTNATSIAIVAAGLSSSVGGHTHTASGTSATDSNSPPYVDVVFAKANTNVTAFPTGMIVGFNATTGVSGSWDFTISQSGGTYYQKFLRANSSSPGGTGGDTTSTHSNATMTTNILGSGAVLVGPGATKSISTYSHTHNVVTSFSTDDNTPEYTDLLLAKYSPIYTPDTRNWRWYDAEDVADPANTNGGATTVGNAMDSENTAPTNTRIVYLLNATKLRFAVGETGGAGGTDVKYKLQYDTSTAFSSATDVGAQGGTTALWRYYNGDNVADDDAISTVRLSGSPSAGRHNEDSTTGIGQGSTFDPSASTTYEHEFTIQNYNGANDTIYYFRLQYMVNSAGAGAPGSWTTIALNGSYAYPSLHTATTADLEVAQAPANVALGNYTIGGGGTHQYIFQAGEEIAFWDKRGTAAGYDVTVSALSLVCLACGPDTIPGTDITWTSTTGVLHGAFASDATGMTGNTGQTLNTSRNAYVASSSADPTVRTGGFFFLPTLDIANLDSRVPGSYVGTLTITVI